MKYQTQNSIDKGKEVITFYKINDPLMTYPMDKEIFFSLDEKEAFQLAFELMDYVRICKGKKEEV